MCDLIQKYREQGNDKLPDLLLGKITRAEYAAWVNKNAWKKIKNFFGFN